jgi:signal transduction histidine kinase
VTTLESTHQRKDGSPFPVRISAAPASAADTSRVILVVEDMTAERSRRSEEEAIVEERRRIAREIHDGLAQNLASLRLQARLWHNLIDRDPGRMHAEVDAMRDLLKEQIREVRRSIFALRPVALDELGFDKALRQFVDDLGEQNQLQVELSILGPEDHLPSALEPVLFRIVQEAMNNIRKHAQASTAWIELDLGDVDSLVLVIRDDGVGFNPATLDEAARLGHLGLRQMRERVEELEGRLLLGSQPGKGTEIRVVLPTS